MHLTFPKDIRTLLSPGLFEYFIQFFSLVEVVYLGFLNKYLYNCITHNHIIFRNLLKGIFLYRTVVTIKVFVLTHFNHSSFYKLMMHFNNLDLFHVYSRLLPYQIDLYHQSALNVYECQNLFRWRMLNKYENDLFFFFFDLKVQIEFKNIIM